MNPAISFPATPRFSVNDPVRKAGFFLLSLYFFLNYSRVLDITVPSLHLPLFVGLALYATAALAGSIQRALATPAGKLLVALTGWMLLSSVFGAWPGGSLKNMGDGWTKAFPFYFTVIGLCLTTDQIFRFLRTVSVAFTVMCCVALWRGDNILGRLIISNSRFADPNDLALVCLLGLSFMAFFIFRKEKILPKLFGAGMFVICFYALTRTGSRGAFVALIAGALYLFLKASMLNKMKMGVALVVCVLLAAAILPPEVYVRYAGMFSDDAPGADTHEAAAAEGSSEARMYLLQQSLWITLAHPVLGVGPSCFRIVENEMARARGYRNGAWHETHNMYTQASSELGIPGAMMFIAILALSLRSTGRTLKLSKQHPMADAVHKAAFCLRLSLMMFSVAGFFLSVAYSDMLPLLSGLAIALEMTVREEIVRAQRALAQQPRAVTPQQSAFPAKWRDIPALAGVPR